MNDMWGGGGVGVGQQRPFTIDFDTLDYEVNNKIVKNLDFKLIPYKNHQAINGTMLFRTDVNGIRILNWNWKIYNVTVNGCDILINKYNKLNVITEAVIQRIKQSMPGLPSKCPLNKGVEYPLLNLYLDEERFPVYMSNIKFETSFIMLNYRELVFDLKLSAHVESKIGKRMGNQTSKKP
ncbi:uncharacterized protein LOC133332380 [Musca vetustissima]|uniref:uncharacterized protein LOC133332380 n=1 Tax=Musca vetustissima TaxID=27455 RepID=UPI002AB70E8A|nr:uncharacterized protein LOC133332380 [Musca vetustissima]